MDQESAEIWTAQTDSQTGQPKSHRLLAALRRLGYRARHRYIVFQVLPHTLGLGPEVWRVLDKCHHMRNVAEYEGVLDMDERIVADLVAACEMVMTTIHKLIQAP